MILINNIFVIIYLFYSFIIFGKLKIMYLLIDKKILFKKL